MFFKKNKPKVEFNEKIIYFSKEEIEKLYPLYDNAVEQDNKVSKHLLWNFIYKTLNLTHDEELSHELDLTDIMRPYVVIKKRK